MKIYLLNNCEYWYDRSQRCWYAARRLTEQGDLGASVNFYTKEEILEAIHENRLPVGHDEYYSILNLEAMQGD